jgi:hypothetical protein
MRPKGGSQAPPPRDKAMEIEDSEEKGIGKSVGNWLNKSGGQIGLLKNIEMK